jgi:hypothetical protein
MNEVPQGKEEERRETKREGVKDGERERRATRGGFVERW